MKVGLIRGPALLVINSTSMRSSQPLGLAYIAAAIQQAGHEVYVIDAVAESPDEFHLFYDDLYCNGISYDRILERIAPDTDVIGMSCMFSFNWLSDRHLIQQIGLRYPEMQIIAGGEHITALPEFCIRQAYPLKACVLGEGEETIVELLEALEGKKNLAEIKGIVYRNESGEPVKNLPRTRKKDLDQLPWPLWEVFPMEAYFTHKLYYGVDPNGRTLPVMATRGCPFRCTFCSSPDMWGTQYYMRDPELFLKELKYYIDTYQINNFDFFDLTAIIDKKWIIRFCKLVIEHNLNITWQIPAGTRSEAIDEEVAGYLYRAGCRNITYAPESGSEKILKIIKKRVLLRNMLKSMRYSSSQGMNIKLNMIIGFPEDTHSTLWETLRFQVKSSFAGANDMAPAVFHPYPGSAYFRQLVEEKQISLENDQYFLDLIYVNYLNKIKLYNSNINREIFKWYVPLNYLVFYGSNYLFRPYRLFRSLWNVIRGKVQSRAEMFLLVFMQRKKSRIYSDTFTINAPKVNLD